MARYTAKERIGVNAVENIVINELGWIFREQPIVDVGIDAHIERVDEDNPSGQLIALQIKTGPGNFHETADAYVYYGSLVHLEYWIGHSLPVVLVAHLPKSGETFWVAIDESTIERTKKNWKVSIPKENIFGAPTADALAVIFVGNPAQQRLRKLSIDEPLMRHIEKGGKVSLELEDWIHKSLGRTPVRVFICDENDEETLSQDWYTYYTGYGIQELAEAIFPWADVKIDSDFYDEHNDFETDLADELSRATDLDNDIPPYELNENPVYPYSESGGEVQYYRLMLTLNDLGMAFLTVSDHIGEPG